MRPNRSFFSSSAALLFFPFLNSSQVFRLLLSASNGCAVECGCDGFFLRFFNFSSSGSLAIDSEANTAMENSMTNEQWLVSHSSPPHRIASRRVASVIHAPSSRPSTVEKTASYHTRCRKDGIPSFFFVSFSSCNERRRSEIRWLCAEV